MSNEIKVFKKIPKKEVNIKKMNNNGVYHFYPKGNTEDYVCINDYNERIVIQKLDRYSCGRIIISGSLKNGYVMDDFIDDIIDWIKPFAEFRMIINHYNEDEPQWGNTISITNDTDEDEPEINVISIKERYEDCDTDIQRYKTTQKFETD